MSETALVKACLTWLLTQGCYVYRQNSGATVYSKPGQPRRFVRFGQPGASDIVGCGPHPYGRAVFVECKRTTKPTHHQLAFMAAVKIRGAFTAIVRSVDDLERAWHEQGMEDGRSHPHT